MKYSLFIQSNPARAFDYYLQSQQCQVNYNFLLTMFYIGTRIRGRVEFTHREMPHLGNHHFVLRKLRKTYEGRCLREMGYLIQILNVKDGEFSNLDLRIEEQCISTKVYFSCLLFKPDKGEILDFTIEKVGEDMLQGWAGQAKIMISSSSMAGFQFNHDTNSFQTEINDQILKAEPGNFMRARIVQYIVEDGEMILFCETDPAITASLLKEEGSQQQ